MTVKYHISPTTGNPNKCYATKRCPFGDLDKDHFGSKEAAREAYEERQRGAVTALPRKRASKLEKLAATYSTRETWGEYSPTPSLEELQAAAAQAQIKNSFIAAGFRSEDDHSPLHLYQEYDGTGDAHQITGVREFLIATPAGEFVKVRYEATLAARLDSGWEFSPDLYCSYNYYDSPEEAVAAFESRGGEERVRVATESVFRESNGYNGDQPSYDWRDEDSTRRKAQEALRQLANPYEVARVARLKKSNERLDGKLLLGQSYIESKSASVRAAVAAREELPLEAHGRLLTDRAAQVRMSLATRPDLSADTVERLLQQDNRWKDGNGSESPREVLLRNPALPGRVITSVAQEGVLEDLRALARNPKLPQEVKETMKARTGSLGINLFR